MTPRLAVLAAAACLASCSGPLIKPALAPTAQKHDALLILPGFGYGRDGGEAFKRVARSAAAAGIDVYVPKYVTRSGLDDSRAELERFIRDQRLDRYDRLHVFAFLAGAWTLNPLLDRLDLPNLTTVVYDRSPYQERAPKIAAAKLPRRARLRFGQTIFDVANTPYPALLLRQPNVALIVESSPTPFILSHAKDAQAYGAFDFSCGSFGERYDDCAYVAMNHTELYERFETVWVDVREFILTGRFRESANRTPPAAVALATVRR